MKFSSILLSIILHFCLFLFLITFFNTKSNQRIRIERNLVTIHFEENPYEKDKLSKILSNAELKNYKTKKDETIKNLKKKLKNNNRLVSHSQASKDKNFELKKDIKKIKSFVPKISKELIKKKSVINYDAYNKKSFMSVIPRFENYKNKKLDQKFYSCIKTQRSTFDINKKNKEKLKGNEKITINALLGYNIYNYNPNFVNISSLLKSEKIIKKKNVNISELLKQKSKNNINCN